MATWPWASDGWKALAAALVAAGCMGLSPLQVSAPAWVRNALSLGRSDDLHGAPTVARFVMDEGGGFVLDRSHRPVLLRFDDDPEVWALQPSPGPRGDTLYKDDVGDVMLRATKFGGVTVFTPRHPEGLAASLAGPTTALKLTPLGPQALYQRLIFASIRCSRASRHLIAFDAPETDEHSAALVADSASLTVEAVVAVAGRPRGKALLSRIGKVVLIVGPRPSVGIKRGLLMVAVTPAQGLAGHPSSARIIAAISGP